MTAKVLQFPGITRLDVDPDQVLESAVGEVDGVLVLGFDKDGEFYCASSYADGATALWLMELCKKELLRDHSDD